MGGPDVLQSWFRVDALLHNSGPSIPMATIEQAAVYLAQELHRNHPTKGWKCCLETELEIFHHRRQQPVCMASLKVTVSLSS